ncbi:MAG: DUF5317 domain-containing protein [Bacillota bacterium]|nr:MAG: hypothetical protein DIU70_13420 [Bacillota bacterium]
MAPVLVYIALAVGVALLRGGRFPQELPFRYGWLVPLALALQLAAFLFPGTVAARGLVLGSYVLLCYVLIANHRYQSVRLILLGVILNGVAIAANGGRIPVDVEAARSVGLEVASLEDGADAKHVALTPETHLPFLGDVIPVPPPVGRVFSIGDIAILVGLFLLIQDLMERPIVLRLSPGAEVRF